jgi:uncharacterized Zn finger protein (UPF0148 family)
MRRPGAKFLSPKPRRIDRLKPHAKYTIVMDINFKCIHCNQDLTVDASGAGVEIQCPSCGQPLLVPAEGKIVNPIMASAGAREVKHFVVPQHQEEVKKVEIEKPKPTLEASAKETDKKLKVRTIRRSDCVEVGKDHFDEAVGLFLDKVGEANVKSITPLTYTHQDLASRQWITDFGVLIVYMG